MARQITLSETSPGNFQVMGMSGDAANPFAGSAQTTAMTTQQSTVGQWRATLPNGQVVTFASEADYLKADQWVRSMGQQSSTGGAAPILGSPSATGGSGWLRTGAEAAETVVGFLEGRALNRKLEDLDETLNRLDRAEVKLEALRASYPDLVGAILDVLKAERDATVIAQDALEDMISAVDIKSGAGAAKVISQFVNGSGSSGASNLGTTLAVGGVGLGIGVMLNRDSDRRRRRR